MLLLANSFKSYTWWVGIVALHCEKAQAQGQKANKVISSIEVANYDEKERDK